MGGQSYKCPYCARWELNQRYLRQHLLDAHRVKPHFKIVGVGPVTKIVGLRGEKIELNLPVNSKSG